MADKESRQVNTATEWALSGEAFEILVENFGRPEVHLFASQNNDKCTRYVSWHKDPSSIGIDTFTINWGNFYFYAFPPFNMVLRTLQKIIQDKAKGIVVVPLWTSQPWYPFFSSLIVDKAIEIKSSINLLSCPSGRSHPLAY